MLFLIALTVELQNDFSIMSFYGPGSTMTLKSFEAVLPINFILANRPNCISAVCGGMWKCLTVVLMTRLNSPRIISDLLRRNDALSSRKSHSSADFTESLGVKFHVGPNGLGMGSGPNSNTHSISSPPPYFSKVLHTRWS